MRDTLSMASAAPNLHPEACFDRTHTTEGGGPAGAPFGPLHLSHLRLGNMHSKWNVAKKSPTGYRDMNGYGLFITVICYQYLSPVTCFVGMQKTAPECRETTQMRCWSETNGLHHLRFLGRRANDDVDDWVMEPLCNTIGITVGWLLLWQVVASGSKMQGHQVRPTKL